MTLSNDNVKDSYLGKTPGLEEELPRRMKTALEFLREIKVQRYLDIGCGDGNFTSLVQQQLGDSEIYGIDFSPKAVKKTSERGIRAFCVDISHERVPFDSDFFDAVFAGEVVEHVLDTDHFLDEVHRVLKVGGHLILSTPNLASIHNRLVLLMGYEPFTNNPSLHHEIGHLREVRTSSEIVPSGDHIRVMTLRSLKQLLKIHSFRIIKISSDGANLRPTSISLRIMHLMDTLASRIPRLSYRVVLLCRKE